MFDELKKENPHLIFVNLCSIKCHVKYSFFENTLIKSYNLHHGFIILFELLIFLEAIASLLSSTQICLYLVIFGSDRSSRNANLCLSVPSAESCFKI